VLETGVGNDTVNVEATTGALSVNNSGGQDSVYVGSNGSALGGNVQGINGQVLIDGAGATALTVDDGSDTIGRTATLANGPIPFFGNTLGLIAGLAPAPIVWIPADSAGGDVTGLTVYGGSGGNTVNVEGTGAPVTMNGGNGNDTYVFTPTTESLDNIQGTVTINGGTGTNTLIVDDQNDPYNGETYTIGAGAIQRTAE